MPAVEASSRRASVPVAIPLDHSTSIDTAERAINLGCNGVMVDASHMPLPDNIHCTRAVVHMAHACGVPMEGEQGYVPGIEGEDAERHPGKISYTTVAEARGYVDQTGVDLLAVSVGTVHGRMKGKPKLDFQRLKHINETLAILLVIHGGTGLSSDQFRKLIANGVAKINSYTGLADAASVCIQKNAKATRNGEYTSLMQDVQDAVSLEAERCIRLWGSAGRATEVLTC
ncbi:MAG: class II fructose-bisphosphate aldolase [Pseudomonadota bacterium]